MSEVKSENKKKKVTNFISKLQINLYKKNTSHEIQNVKPFYLEEKRKEKQV